MSSAGDVTDRTLRVLYRNYRGETARRTITPLRLWFGTTEHHPRAQWLLDVHDHEKGAARTYAFADILETERAPSP